MGRRRSSTSTSARVVSPGRSYYGGHYGTDNDNHYELFSASGMDFIVVHFEYDTTPAPALLAWADSLLQTYSNRRAIIVSHWIVNAGFNASFSAQGQAIYNALSHNPNLFLMLAGHVTAGEGQRTDAVGGRSIWSLLSDYQARTNGGNGWLRILDFSPNNDVIHVKTYSPWLNQFETDSDSQFDIPYDMTGGAPFAVIGANTVPSGTSSTMIWNGLGSGTDYEWYVTVSDGQKTVTGPVWRFRTAGVGNLPPNVSAGPDRTVTLPAAANLDGTVTDDGLPGPFTTTWSKFSGPGTVTFGNVNAVDTTASFSSAGSYTLRLTANDGALSAFDDVVVTVNATNQAPSVNAGLDQAVTLPAAANLDGTVTDDGLPGPFTTTWSKFSGPGTVTFGNVNAVDTTASFSSAGLLHSRDSPPTTAPSAPSTTSSSP